MFGKSADSAFSLCQAHPVLSTVAQYIPTHRRVSTGVVLKFLDSNRSRNPKLAKLMRAMKLREERGQGIDTVESERELEYLPSPAITVGDDFTRVTIFDHKTLRQFSSQERT